MTEFIQYKTKNQIFKDFLDLTNAALTAFNIKGWTVKRLYQTIKTVDLKPFVFLQITNKKQASTQGKRIKKTEQTYLKQYSTKQEVTLRFSATMRNKNDETVATLDSIDILEYIKNWLQSDAGILALSHRGYAQYRATDINQQSFTNDDENVQFLPYFDCTYTYTDVWHTGINNISKVEEIGIYKVN